MLVFRKEKLVFLAIPKTGTTALEGALAPRASIVIREPAVLKHTSYRRFQRFILPFMDATELEAMDVMAVVRHPVDWLSSWFRYRCRDKLIGHPNSTREVSFDEFVLEYCKPKPAPFADVGSQAGLLLDIDGKMAANRLFRYEAQETITEFLQDRFGTYPEPKRLNISPTFKTNISPDVLDKLKEIRKSEFDAWHSATD